jgi:hypothetical protein
MTKETVWQTSRKVGPVTFGNLINDGMRVCCLDENESNLDPSNLALIHCSDTSNVLSRIATLHVSGVLDSKSKGYGQKAYELRQGGIEWARIAHEIGKTGKTILVINLSRSYAKSHKLAWPIKA